MFRRWLHTTLTEMHPGHLFDVLVPPEASMGDYSVNLAFVLAKKEKKNPHQVAQAICEGLMAKGGEMIEKCEVAGPGFVNVFLKDSYLQSQVGKNDVPNVGEGKKIIIEYPSTNVAKPMHVGHSRTAFIGDALARVHEALGFDVVRWDHVGDWGTQFGMIIAAYKEWGNEDMVKAKPLETLNDLYVRYQSKITEDPAYTDRAREEFLKLEQGDSENTQLWQWFTKESLTESHQAYAQLGLLPSHKEIGESFYLPALPALIQELKDAGIATSSEGALVIDLEQFGLPTALIQKTDGASVYLTRDIASLQYRIKEENPVRILYVVANQQALHLEQLFAIAQLAKLGPVGLAHVKFGLVLGEDGKKLATRQGTATLLAEVVDKVVALAKSVVKQKNPELSEEQVDEIAAIVGIGALKYNDLRQHPHSDIVFDWNAMLNLGGNSGPYLQYSYARMASILHKGSDGGTADMSLLFHPTERALMRHLIDFGDAVAACAHFYTLNGLALYLATLAELSNRYYEEVRVLDDEHGERKAARLTLIKAITTTLKNGLNLLGIQTLERI